MGIRSVVNIISACATATENNELLQYVLPIVGALISASVPVLFGIYLFVRQKQHELIVERYLHRGLDELHGHCQHIINVHMYNWALCMTKLKLFRDAPDEIDASKIYDGYEKLRPDGFPFSAASRVNALTNSGTFWEAFQLISAFGSRSQNFCTLEFPMVLKAVLDKKIIGKNQEIYDDAFSTLKKLDDDANSMLTLMGLMSSVSLIFETSKLTLNTVFKIHKNEKVVAAIFALKEEIKKVEAELAV